MRLTCQSFKLSNGVVLKRQRFSNTQIGECIALTMAASTSSVSSIIGSYSVIDVLKMDLHADAMPCFIERLLQIVQSAGDSR
jgi:hypothetical protein